MSQNNKKCLKCKQYFKGGENYVEVSNNPKAGTYHKECWAEIEQEQQNNNNYPICQECKKTIKAGEEYAKETMPDAFQPHDVYYHKSCWEKKQRNDDNINTRRACSTCGHIGLPGACQYCIMRNNHRGTNGNSDDNNDDTERERERESKTYNKTHLRETNALIVESLLTPKASVTLVHV